MTPIPMSPCESCYNEVVDLNFDTICSTCREVAHQEQRSKSRHQLKHRLEPRCFGCGKTNAGDPCAECREYLLQYEKEHASEWHEAKVEDARRSSGNSGVSVKEYHSLMDAHSKKSQQIKNAHKQIEDLKLSIRELKEWAEEKGQHEKTKGENSTKVINLFKEITEHCDAALEKNE